MIAKINPTMPIPIVSNPIPDEEREITIAKSNIAIPNPICFIVSSPFQIQIHGRLDDTYYFMKNRKGHFILQSSYNV